MIRVLFFATFREYTGEKETSANGVTSVEELLRLLGRRYGDAFESHVFEGNTLSSQAILMVNGRHIAHTGGASTPLKEGDTVALFPLLGGG
ncbi:MAG TPA: MoaD/ThiS family protein [Synergistaceae bacterium]|nr:MoaD/ThiS family protein [Synergistaceae bacterium]HPJ26622.1 MoaD/ThiS family protein [Synergistaceae bacterium]HPQ37801.1 MoaD/ThiS family protein [Synergistaceae bacterium]